MTALVARATFLLGSLDSDAAMVTISASTGPQPDHKQRPKDDKDDDRSDLYPCEPELELAVGANGVKVGGGECQDQNQGNEPWRYIHVLSEDARRHGGLEPNHDGPEVPVEPPYGEPGPVAKGHPCIV